MITSEPETRLSSALSQLADLLERIGHPRATEVRVLRTQLQASPELALQRLDSNDWWAGAGSLAADTMADHPGISEALWQPEVREFRALLIEIGETLQARGIANPGISSWLLAFHNWNASEV